MSQTAKARRRSRLAKAALVLGSAAALTVGLTGSASAGILNPLPGNASTFQNKYMPYFDYDSDSCFPAAAVDANGHVNGGLYPSGSLTGGCRTGHLGKANTYAQSLCKNGWCAYAYTLYFEKDQCDPTSIIECGHRHDWESVVVFQKQGEERPRYLAASRHGGYSTHPINQVPMNGNHVEIVYHKDGPSTHAFRFAKWGERPEAWGNGGWDRPGLVNYSRLSTTLKSRLNDTNWGSANFQLGKNFISNINKARPSAVPAF
ncbi:NPP1 family protein [Streptomyces sp. DG2A-72]|uniref:NPP1 family protein n=1 Tax=Streptomyces sp. DG2A-72 TaxID=3051386 RepID=UPI00265C4385|nr:NPP1 family protein [Streptomyces sp. DG2A-72]MDO0934773.1 NPP1 family protein [Streptomyces sp. DG2A-72]